MPRASRSPFVEPASSRFAARFTSRLEVVPLVLIAVAVACSARQPSPIVVRASGGLDGAAFAGEPKVARVELRVRDSGGSETVVASATAAAGTLEVPDAVRAAGGIGALALAGLAADGTVLTYGRTPPIELGGLDQTTISIGVLVARLGVATRAVRLVHAPVGAPRIVSVGAQFAVVAGADGRSLERFDLLSVGVAEETDLLAVAPVTIASAGPKLLALDAAGKATMLTAGSSDVTTPAPPAGISFLDVVGGAVIAGDDGAAYVVGATRATASDVVLRLGDDGSLAVRHLLRARAGAAATWVDGRGLVVVGGIATGDGAASVELLAPGATSSAALPFAADVTVGAVLAQAGGGRLVRVSPDGKVDAFDLGCATACTPTVAEAKLAPATARADDAMVPLDRGGFVVARAGAITVLDAKLVTASPLADFAAAPVALGPISIGAVALAVAGDDVLRVIQ